MKRTKWEHVDTLTGSGIIVHSGTGEQLPVQYAVEVWQEFLEPRRGVSLPQTKETHGQILPNPNWKFSGHYAILQLNDGRRLKCWVDEHGKVTGSCEFVEG